MLAYVKQTLEERTNSNNDNGRVHNFTARSPVVSFAHADESWNARGIWTQAIGGFNQALLQVVGFGQIAVQHKIAAWRSWKPCSPFCVLT